MKFIYRFKVKFMLKIFPISQTLMTHSLVKNTSVKKYFSGFEIYDKTTSEYFKTRVVGTDV